MEKKIIKRRKVNNNKAAFSTTLHPLLQRVYAARNAVSDTDINTDLKHLLPPDTLKGLFEAVSLLADHLTRQKRLLIIGDFDADGATSCALAVLGLKAMGAKQVDFLVPNRFDYGYGLTPEIVLVASKQQPDLIITVDNGVSSIEGVQKANDLGIKVLITDHHLPGDTLPAPAAMVNPNQPGCMFPSKHLAGVGVIFYVLVALRTHLRQTGWFSKQGITEPIMADYLDLVALGTVADVVPLDRNNRILVAQGLRRLRAGKTRPGINALLAIAGKAPHCLVSNDLGFSLGPRLNAAGRLNDISLGIHCLLSDDATQVAAMATQLDEMNRDRKAIESTMQHEATAYMKAFHTEEKGQLPHGLCVYDNNWHQGVIGILASRLKDRYHRPVIAFANAGDGLIKGSARSIRGLHIRDALATVTARHPALVKTFGGHAMAAGLTLPQRNYPLFAKAFDDIVREQLTGDDLQAVIYTDGELQQAHFTLTIAKQLRGAVPWGQHFPEPVFDGVFRITRQRLVGEKHLKLGLAIETIDKQQPLLLNAIAFNVDTDQWPDTSVEALRLVYRLDVNTFRRQEALQLVVEYMEPVAV